MSIDILPGYVARGACLADVPPDASRKAPDGMEGDQAVRSAEINARSRFAQCDGRFCQFATWKAALDICCECELFDREIGGNRLIFGKVDSCCIAMRRQKYSLERLTPYSLRGISCDEFEHAHRLNMSVAAGGMRL